MNKPYVAIICTAERLPLRDDSVAHTICFNLNLSTAVVSDGASAAEVKNFVHDHRDALEMWKQTFATSIGNVEFDVFTITPTSPPTMGHITGTAIVPSQIWQDDAAPCRMTLSDELDDLIENAESTGDYTLLLWDPADPSSVATSSPSSPTNSASVYQHTAWHNTVAHASTWPKPIPQGLYLSFEVHIAATSAESVLIYPRFAGGEAVSNPLPVFSDESDPWNSYGGPYSIGSPPSIARWAFQTPCLVDSTLGGLVDIDTYWIDRDPAAAVHSTSGWRQTLEATIASRFDYFPRLLTVLEKGFGLSNPASPSDAAHVWSLGLVMLQDLSDFGSRNGLENSSIQYALILRAFEAVYGFPADGIPSTDCAQLTRDVMNLLLPHQVDWQNQVWRMLQSVDQTLAKYLGPPVSPSDNVAPQAKNVISTLRSLYSVLSKDVNLGRLLLAWWDSKISSTGSPGSAPWDWRQIQNALANQVFPSAQLHKRYLSAVAENARAWPANAPSIKDALGTPFPGRTGHTALLIESLSQMLVFGGNPGTGTLLNDVWMMGADGDSAQPWTQLMPTGSIPPGLSGHSAVFDASASQMLVFGGLTNHGYGHDVYSLAIPNPLPVPTSIFPASADVKSGAFTLAVSGRGFVVGSKVNWGGSPRVTTFISDAKITAAITGADLASIGQVAVMVNNPAPGGGTSIALTFTINNPSHGITSLPAPSRPAGSQTSNEPVISSGSLNPVWTKLTPALGSPGTLPPARSGHSAVYDSENRVMIVFGGDVGTPAHPVPANDVWVLDNATSGSPIWSQPHLAPGPLPPARIAHTAVYDSAHNCMIVFGGRDANGVVPNDVWVLQNADGTGSPGVASWSKLPIPVAGSPVGRHHHSAIYDASSKSMVIFGGVVNGTTGFEAWVLSNANGMGGAPAWMQIFPIGQIPSKEGHTAAYDTSGSSDRMIVFSGGPDLVPDVWVLSNPLSNSRAWTRLNPSGNPQLDAAVKASVRGWVHWSAKAASVPGAFLDEVDALVAADVNDPQTGLSTVADDTLTPEKRPHPIVIQVSGWDTSTQDDPSQDLRHIAGVAMLMRKSGSPASHWRCLNAADITVNYQGTSPGYSALLPDKFVPSRLQYRNKMKDPFLAYDNHPLIAKSPATGLQGQFQGGMGLWTPNTTYNVGDVVGDSRGHRQECIQKGISGSDQPSWDNAGTTTTGDGTVVWTDRGKKVSLFTYAPSKGLYGKIYGLVFGTTYEFAPFAIGHGGAMPREIEQALNSSPPAEIQFDDRWGTVIRQVPYYRRVPIGHIRVVPPPEIGSPASPYDWAPNPDNTQWPVIPPTVYPLARDLGLTGSGGTSASPQDSGGSGDKTPLLLLPFANSGAVSFSVLPPVTDINTWDRWVADGSVYGANTTTTRKAVWAAFHRDSVPPPDGQDFDAATNRIGDPAVGKLLFQVEQYDPVQEVWTPVGTDQWMGVSYPSAQSPYDSAAAWKSVWSSPIPVTVQSSPDSNYHFPPATNGTLTISIPAGKIARLTVTPLVKATDYSTRFEPNMFLATSYSNAGTHYESVGINYQALGVDKQSFPKFTLLMESPTTLTADPTGHFSINFDENSRQLNVTLSKLLSQFSSVGKFEIHRQDWRWLGRPLPGLPAADLWQPSTTYGLGNIVSDPRGHQQKCTQAGISGVNPPNWNDAGGASPLDGTVMWTDLGKWTLEDSEGLAFFDVDLWQPNTAYRLGNTVNDMQGHEQQCTQAGTSGSTPPNWNNAGGTSPLDGTVLWSDQGEWTTEDWEDVAFYKRLPSEFRVSDRRFNISAGENLELTSIDLSGDLRCQYIRFIVQAHNRYEDMRGFRTSAPPDPDWKGICVPRAFSVPKPAKPMMRLVLPIVQRSAFDLLGIANDTWYRLGGLGETLTARIQPVLGSKVATIVFGGSPGVQDPIAVDEFGGDNGVVYLDSGAPLTLATGSPADELQAGEYYVVTHTASPSDITAQYFFSEADAGVNVVISYNQLDQHGQQHYEYGPDQIVDGSAATLPVPTILMEPMGATLDDASIAAPTFSNTYFKGSLVTDSSNRTSWNQFKVQFRRELQPFGAVDVPTVISDWTDAMWVQTIPDSATFKTAAGPIQLAGMMATWTAASPNGPAPVIVTPPVLPTGPTAASPSTPLFELWFVVTQRITDASGNPAEVYLAPVDNSAPADPLFVLSFTGKYNLRIVEVQKSSRALKHARFTFDDVIYQKGQDEMVRIVRISPPIPINH